MSYKERLSTYERLLEERIIFISGEITTDSANLVIAQLIEMEAEDSVRPITMYINSPGGEVRAGLGIKNTMDFINCPVHTIGIGLCASMGAFLLASGEKGHRAVLKDTTVMIHQLLGGTRGQGTDIRIYADETDRLKNLLTQYLSDYTNGITDYKTMYDLCERDNYLSAERALELGLIDRIVTKRKKEDSVNG